MVMILTKILNLVTTVISTTHIQDICRLVINLFLKLLINCLQSLRLTVNQKRKTCSDNTSEIYKFRKNFHVASSVDIWCKFIWT